MAYNIHIDSFAATYASEFKKYESFAYDIRDLIDKIMKKHGIMAIVTARAKDPKRLKPKLEKKDDERIARGELPFQSTDEIKATIHDLIGARIALYFPTDAARIEELLTEDFSLIDAVKVFPPKVPNSLEIEKKNCTAHMRKIYPGYDSRRFDGYHATHYLVKLKPSEGQTFNPDIEIQVASVLMHAWSEVEHDLAYKKMTGAVSREEYECLDEINGLVIAGEIALNRLKQLSQQRLQGQKTFETVFMLREYLSGWLQQRGVSESNAADSQNSGNVETLFFLYQRKNMLTRAQVDKELKNVEHISVKSLSELVYWMTEWFRKDNKKIYTDVIREIMAQDPDAVERGVNARLGAFLGAWNQLEDRIRKLLRARGFKGSNADINWRHLVDDPKLDETVCNQYYMLRLARNRVVHANRPPSMEKILRLEADLKALNALLDEIYGLPG